MNRFQRNYYRNRPFPPNRKTDLNPSFVNEFSSPASPLYARSYENQTSKVMYNRSCYVTPELKDFAQSMDLPVVLSCGSFKGRSASACNAPASVMAQETIRGDFIPITIARLRELRRLLGFDVPKVENSSQFTRESTREPSILETSDGAKWKKVDNADDVAKIITEELKKDDADIQNDKSLSLNSSQVFISDIPTVHVIAEKFTKYKKDNIEVRRLEEKIVCVEYDIYDNVAKNAEPVQKMRAFFSIKPQILNAANGEVKENVRLIPSEIKNEFNISNSDLKKLNNREIEIIDAKISEHNTYLEDLRSIMKRKHILDAKKNKRFDLRSMYEMAKRNKIFMEDEDITDSNIFTKAELDDIKELVLQKTDSNISGITRRTLPPRKGIVTIMEDDETSMESQSFVKELFMLNL